MVDGSNDIDDDVFVASNDASTKPGYDNFVTIALSDDVGDNKNHSPKSKTNHLEEDDVTETQLTTTGSWYDLLPWPPSQLAATAPHRLEPSVCFTTDNPAVSNGLV
jgi:hypothetical protein